MKTSFPILLAAAGAVSALVLLSGCATDDRRTTNEFFQDRALSQRVETALQEEDQIRELDLETNTVDGVVHLSGSAENPEQRYRAEEIVEGVAGVDSVINNISVGEAGALYGGREADEEEEETEAETEEHSRAEEEPDLDTEVDPGLESEIPEMEAQEPEAAGSPTRN